MALSKTLYPVLNTGSTQEDPSDMTEKLLTGMYSFLKKIFFEK